LLEIQKNVQKEDTCC